MDAPESTDNGRNGSGRARAHRVLGLPDPRNLLFDVIVPRAVDSIHPNELLEHIDLDRLLARIDVDALIARVDVDALIDRLDVGRLLARVDIADIIKRAEIDAVITAQATTFGNRLLYFIRRQLKRLDEVTTRAVGRLLRRQEGGTGPQTEARAAGASRLTAFLVDFLLIALLFAGGVALALFMGSLFLGRHLSTNRHGTWYAVSWALFALAYQWVFLVVAGKTPGMGLAGLRVSAPDGRPLAVAAATRRVVVYPFSFILGLGLIGIVVGRRHRALHDVAAPSAVRYDWGERSVDAAAPVAAFEGRAA